MLEALAMNPEDADAHYNLGRLYGLTGRTDQAAAEFREALHLDPTNAEAHFNLGRYLGRKGAILPRRSVNFERQYDPSPIMSAPISTWAAPSLAPSITIRPSPNSLRSSL